MYGVRQGHAPLARLPAGALFIWIAENVGAFTSAWIYPAQADGWDVVPLSKLGSRRLLMLLSFALVTLAHRPDRVESSATIRGSVKPAPAE